MRWRLFLACLLMAAIPLQGFAATTMMLCASGAAHQVAAPAMPMAPMGSDHGHSHGHGAAAEHGAHAGHSAAAPDPADGAGLQHDAVHDVVHDLGHKCSLCAACCHHLALAEWPQWAPLAGLPQAQAREPFVFVLAPPTQLPDKPPRG